MKDQMIEATERHGVDPDDAYDHVRESMADRADRQRDDMDRAEPPPATGRDRLFVNDERTVLVRLWASGVMEIAVRETTAHTWGPPRFLKEEK